MLNGKLIKMDRVIENVYRDYGFDNLDWMHCVEWIGECLDLIGAPMAHVEMATDGNEKLGHPEHITIEEGRGHLPCNMHRLIQAFRCDDGNWIPMRVNTDTSHIAYHCGNSVDASRSTNLTYKLNKDHIHTSFKDGKVMLVYRANPVDENGYPMLPDNIKFIKACVAYVGDKVLFKKEVQGKPIKQKIVDKIERDMLWYIGAADTAARIPTIDQMESWKNNFTKLLPDINTHASAFRGDGEMERRFNNSQNDNRSRGTGSGNNIG